ncbi:hypothetical protein Tco_1556471 [Tanacetum coccineum]
MVTTSRSGIDDGCDDRTIAEKLIEYQKECNQKKRIPQKKVRQIEGKIYFGMNPDVLRYRAVQNRPFSKAEDLIFNKKVLKKSGGIVDEKHLLGKEQEKSKVKKVPKDRRHNMRRRRKNLKPIWIWFQEKNLLWKLNLWNVMDLHRLVEERYATSRPEGYDLMLWGDLKILFQPDEEDEHGRIKHEYNLISWRLFDSCGIHILLMDNGIAIHMMIVKKYPLTQEMLSKMLSRKLEVDHENEMVFELLRFIRSQVQK